MRFSLAITELGEPTLLVPLSVLFCTFLAMRSRAWALRWTQAFLLCAVSITAAKVCFIACPQSALGLRSPSGHAAISSLFFPSLTWFAAADSKRKWRAILIAAGIAFAAVIAITRVLLLAHSRSEVVLGAAIGLGSFAYFMCGDRYRNEAALRRAGGPVWLLMIGLLALTWALYGEQVPFERLLRSAAFGIRAEVPVCRT